MAKILLAEDEAFTALTLQKLLAEYGHQVEIVDTGAKVLAAVADGRPDLILPDLILMDVGLAGSINGIEAARQVRMLHPIPIVFITGYADQESMKEALVLSKAYIKKPLSIEILVQAINSVFAAPDG